MDEFSATKDQKFLTKGKPYKLVTMSKWHISIMDDMGELRPFLMTGPADHKNFFIETNEANRLRFMVTSFPVYDIISGDIIGWAPEIWSSTNTARYSLTYNGKMIITNSIYEAKSIGDFWKVGSGDYLLITLKKKENRKRVAICA